jgi:hypothetical protein
MARFFLAKGRKGEREKGREGRGTGKGGKRCLILREGPCIPQEVPAYCFRLPSCAYLFYSLIVSVGRDCHCVVDTH